MTSHWHWLHNYFPFCVPIWLANNTIVYSKGVGNVVFNPVVSGGAVRPVEFTQVLHVPDLQNNLLTVLPLSQQHGIHVHICPTEQGMIFLLDGQRLFVAPINQNNLAFLNGMTEIFTEHVHCSISTLPADINLWHSWLTHHGYDVQ